MSAFSKIYLTILRRRARGGTHSADGLNFLATQKQKQNCGITLPNQNVTILGAHDGGPNEFYLNLSNAIFICWNLESKEALNLSGDVKMPAPENFNFEADLFNGNFGAC